MIISLIIGLVLVVVFVGVVSNMAEECPVCGEKQAEQHIDDHWYCIRCGSRVE